MRRPSSIEHNDKAVIVSPAGRIDKVHLYNAAAILNSWGLKPIIAAKAFGEAGRFSGSVNERLNDLQQAFDDPLVKVILCARGGYGTLHLLRDLSFKKIKAAPKWLIGFSDITALHAALQLHGISSIHGPMVKHFSEEGPEDRSINEIKAILSGSSPDYKIPITKYNSLNRQGTAVGKLFGGNLSVFSAIVGSKFVKIPAKGILFIEDIGEAPYRVDRMIFQLKLAGLFDRIAGFIVGQFTQYEEDSEMYLPLYESIAEALKEYNFPICFDFPVGHVKLNLPLIMGETAQLVVDKDFVEFKQSSV